MGSPWIETKNFGDVNRKSAQTSLSEEAPGGSHRSVRQNFKVLTQRVEGVRPLHIMAGGQAGRNIPQADKLLL